MLNPKVAAALTSAIIAAIVSFGTAFWTTKSEMDKAVRATQHSALIEVIQARLSAYPQGYQLVSQMVKRACDTVDGEKPITRKDLEILRFAFDDWDSRNAHLLGPDATNTVFGFRQQLLNAISASQPGDLSCGKLSTLLHHAGQVELALRSDLGIYGFELQGATQLQTPAVKRY